MASGIAITTPLIRPRQVGGPLYTRVLLIALTALAVGLGAALASTAPASTVEPDLARLLRYMALLKGAFAAVALGISFWRLARPAALWREVIYVGGPALMAGGALCLWQLQAAGLAAAGLHVGMFALLAAGLTDRDFIPALRRRSSAPSPLPDDLSDRVTARS